MMQDDELLQEFVVESSEHLADVEGQLLEIEERGDDIDLDLVNTVFRAVHSVKGAAGFLGLTKINELSHNLENVLNQIRNQELIPTGTVVEVLLRSADLLRNMVSDVGTSNDVDVSSQVADLKKILAGEYSADPQVDAVAQTMIDVAEEVSAAAHPVPVAASAANQDCDVAVPPTNQDFELPPGFGSSEASETKSTAVPKAPLSVPAPPVVSAGTKPATSNVAPVAKDKSIDKPSAKAAPRQTESNVRVNVAILDRLMNLAGELVLGRNQLLQSISNSSSQDKLEAIAGRLDQVTSELQEAIMQTRMQPVGTVFNRFPRVVRDLSAKLGKKCVLEIEGSEVEVDKTIIEAIGDPLTHLVRNSVDHGIEPPEVRIRNGKKEEGYIRLRAFHQAGKVCVRIEDNGGGMDPQRIKAKALSNGLISEAEAASMSTSDTLRLIFAPGFSTAAAVTDVSGRGVGMDVVKTNIEQIGGTVDVESELGVGSAIHITLPLTLAIVPSMIIGCGGDKFAIPQTNILELVRVPISELNERIGNIQGAEVLRLRGALLPLVRLERVLNIGSEFGSSASQRTLNIVVVESGQFRYGVAVEELFDSEEIVVKPLGRQLKDLGYLAGATILGDGRVALILDISGIALEANLRSCDDLNAGGEDDANELGAEYHRLLLFNNASEEHFAIPMACVSRIERTPMDEIIHVGGCAILPYRGGSLPLISLEEQITAKPRPADLSHLFVIVFSVGKREIGLIAPTLKDICNVAINVDDGSLREPGVAGVVVIEGKPTRLLDTVELVRVSHPEWCEKESHEAKPDGKLILFAEDSAFFRRHVEQTLVEEGYKVTTAIDGQDAWEKLQAMSSLPSLIVTDVEMPNMSGLDLCKSVRGDRRFASLPVIALTSLASDEDVARGKSVGVTEYHVKLDKVSLLDAVARYSTASR